MKIYGKITDSSGEPLTGTIISMVSNPEIGVNSDLNGNFVLDNSKINAFSKIKISYLGYKNKELYPVNLLGKTIVLQDDVLAIDQVTIYSDQRDNSNYASEGMSHFQKNKKKYAILITASIVLGSVIIISKTA